MGRVLFCCTFSIVALFAPIVFAEYEDLNGAKSKREAAGLIAFPRIGRSAAGEHIMGRDDVNFYNYIAQLLANFDNGWTSNKRGSGSSGLIPFPRVGRSGSRSRDSEAYFEDPTNFGSYSSFLKRNQGNGEQNGMWFGPRLGRRKRNTNSNIPWTSGALTEMSNSENTYDNKVEMDDQLEDVGQDLASNSRNLR